MLCKARYYINNDDLVTLYYAIFSSHLISGGSISTLSTQKSLNFRTELFASFHLPTFEQTVIPCIPTSKFLNSVIWSFCKIVCLSMTLSIKCLHCVFIITSSTQEIFINTIPEALTLAASLSHLTAPLGTGSTLLLDHVSRIGMIFLDTLALILFLFHVTS